jgi:hypothetical protein
MDIFVLPSFSDSRDVTEIIMLSWEGLLTEIMALLAASKTDASLPSLLL